MYSTPSSQAKNRPKTPVILIPLSKNKAHYKMADIFMSLCAKTLASPAWKIITKGIYRYLSNYSKSPCYRRDKNVHLSRQNVVSANNFMWHTTLLQWVNKFHVARDVKWPNSNNGKSELKPLCCGGNGRIPKREMTLVRLQFGCFITFCCWVSSSFERSLSLYRRDE